MATFENYQPEEFLGLLNNSRIEINGTGTTSVSGTIKYIRTMLHGESLREFDELASQNNGMASYHLKHITDSLLGYIPPINALSKKKRTMHRAMRKPWYLTFKCFIARLTELNNCLPLFPRSSNANKMTPKELNEILLLATPNSWVKATLSTGMGFWREDLKVYLQDVQAYGNFWAGIWRRNTF